MMEQINPEIIKKTQKSLGKFIKKPVLTEKLLTKPPFRFLHDICTAAMRETGFFEEVLTSSDIKSENIKDRDGKIAFLQKVIAAVEASNNVKLAIKPNKVVAGHEPIRTNEFLQELGKALEKHTLQNGSGTKSSQQSKVQVVQQPKVQTEGITERIKLEKEERVGRKKITSTKQSKKEIPSEEIILEDKSKIKSNDSSLEQNGTKKTQSSKLVVDERVKNNNVRDIKTKDDEKSTRRKERKLKILEQSDDISNIQVNNSNNMTNEKADQAEEKHFLPGSEQNEYKRPLSAKPGHRKAVSVSEAVEQVAELTKPSPTNEVEHSDLLKTEDSINRMANDTPFKRPGSSFMKLNKTIPARTRDLDTTDDSPTPPATITEVRPPTARPASARPAAPKIRDRGEVTVHEDIVKLNLGNVPIIIDNKGNAEPEEDENLVLVEPENVVLADELDNKTDQFESNNEQKIKETDHGLLVEQILETQKELDQNRLQVLDNKIAGKTEIEWQSSRNRESTDREIKKLRTCIQTLTRSTNPLGKLLDFLEEDIDIMQKELTSWMEMNSNLDIQIAEEQSLTEQSIEPLKVYLKELQQVIDQQLEQIVVVKANIIRNDQKLQKLLTDMRIYWN